MTLAMILFTAHGYEKVGGGSQGKFLDDLVDKARSMRMPESFVVCVTNRFIAKFENAQHKGYKLPIRHLQESFEAESISYCSERDGPNRKRASTYPTGTGIHIASPSLQILSTKPRKVLKTERQELLLQPGCSSPRHPCCLSVRKPGRDFCFSIFCLSTSNQCTAGVKLDKRSRQEMRETVCESGAHPCCKIFVFGARLHNCFRVLCKGTHPFCRPPFNTIQGFSG